MRFWVFVDWASSCFYIQDIYFFLLHHHHHHHPYTPTHYSPYILIAIAERASMSDECVTGGTFSTIVAPRRPQLQHCCIAPTSEEGETGSG